MSLIDDIRTRVREHADQGETILAIELGRAQRTWLFQELAATSRATITQGDQPSQLDGIPLIPVDQEDWLTFRPVRD